MSEAQVTERIDPRQIKAKLDEIKTEVESTTDDAKSYAATAGAGVGAAVAFGAYLLGRRKGKKSKSIVEIRRI